MSKPKFTLDPNPTFDLKVPVPVPGAGFAEIILTCKYRNKTQFSQFLDEIKDKSDAEIVRSVVLGWNIDAEFNEENLNKLVENYMGSASSIVGAYAEELMKVREKN